MAKKLTQTPAERQEQGTPLRRCVGSAKYGIEPHEAPLADFPLQPSQKDGIGRMCKPHWTEYTRGLRRDQLARKGTAIPVAEVEANATLAPEAMARIRGGRKPKAEPAHEPDPALVAARDLIASIDRMPAAESKVAMGTDEAQAALALLAHANGGASGIRRSVPDVEPVETPLGDAIDAGAELAEVG